MKQIITALALAYALAANAAGLHIDELAIKGDRTYSYSDKAAGFYYGDAKSDNFSDFYAGWNIEAHRIFADYNLYIDNNKLSRSKSKASIYPNRIERKYLLTKYTNANATEAFNLVDSRKVIYIDFSVPNSAEKIGIELIGEISSPKAEDRDAIITPNSTPDKVVRIAGMNGGKVTIEGSIAYVQANEGGFIITYGTTDGSAQLSTDARANKSQWIAERKARMQKLIDHNSIDCDHNQTDKALAWIMLTADELVTQQHGGWGIYAGFPWFTDFWGRDMFISMPGTVLCTGQFDIAKNILLSFAKYQDLNPASPTYGRVPNRLNLDGILYNTTDGTPRFVMQVYDYLKYTGDKEFIKSIYKNIKIATDASIKLYADEKGYLTHADADTWMDAKRQGVKPCSPRGNRAVDIQALWYDQLVTAAKLATYMGKKDDAKRWNETAEKLRKNFEADFIVNGKITDHLNSDNTADTQLRPNTMFAYELVSADSVKMNDLKTAWTHLVYPWGVASLDQNDDNFHPYHEQWHRYHKDDAYHNGTIWLWNNGIAMQRMIEYNQPDIALQLFDNMNTLALTRGAAGSLSENADAWPRAGQTDVRLSGTFLQSWSNSEQIRVWSQYFLGVRPNLLENNIVIAPRIPVIKNLNTRIDIGKSHLDYTYKNHDITVYEFTWYGKTTNLTIDLPGFKDFAVTLSQGEKITIDINLLNQGTATIYDSNDSLLRTITLEEDADKLKFEQKCDKFFHKVKFAEPNYRENLKCMSRYFDPPLDYYSAE